MLLIKKGQLNQISTSVSTNVTLQKPVSYLFSFTQIMSKNKVSFVPKNVTTLTSPRFDEFEFYEGLPVNLTADTPTVSFEYVGQYWYSIYEQPLSMSANTNPSLASGKIQEGRALVIDENVPDPYYQYTQGNEENANFIFISDSEQPVVTPSITPTITPTPTNNQTPTPTPTSTVTTTPTSTPTQTSTLTQTPTPSITSSSTPTPTPTTTQTSTSTPTPTPTTTETSTPTPTTTPTLTPTTSLTPSPTSTLTPTPTPTNPNLFVIGEGFDNSTGSIYLDSSGTIFVGGLFYGYNNTQSWGMAKLNSLGQIDTTFAAGSNSLQYSTNITGILEDLTGNYLYVWGNFAAGGSQRLVKIDKTTGLNVWTPLTINGLISDLCINPANGDVFINGTFTQVNGLNRTRIAQFNSAGTLLANNFGSGFALQPFNMFFNTNGKLIVAGSFTTYNGLPANRIVELDTTTWANTGIWGTGGNIQVNGIFQDTNTGDYIIVMNNGTMNGQTNGYVGLYDVNGVRITSTTALPVVSIPYGVYYDQTNAHIYISATGYVNTGIGRFNYPSLTPDTTFVSTMGTYLPISAVSQPNTRVIAVDSFNRIYRSGTFVYINGQGYNRIVRMLNNGTINTA
jgi:hypothetical protein